MTHISKLRQLVKGTLLENEPMSKHTSYGIGGPALAYIIPKDRDDLAKITGGHTVPQIIINDKAIGGFNELLQLNNSGKLKKLIKDD